MKRLFPLFLALSVFASASAQANLNVVTTIQDLKAITAEVGGSHVSVDAVAKGTQDPHYIEAKPSFMTKVSRADLVIAVGLELEIGWLPSILRGARNPNVMEGQKGYLEVGTLVKPLELPTGRVSRADGDVHPSGNPHVTLDPMRAGEIAVGIGKKLAELDPAHAADYAKNAANLQSRLLAKTAEWKKRVDASGVKKAVSYHKTLTYFLDRFGIENPAILEPKPGIPPTGGHVLEVIGVIQREKIPLVLVENYFDPTVTNKIKQQIPSIRVATVAVSVEGAPGIEKIDDLYEQLVKKVEGK